MNARYSYRVVDGRYITGADDLERRLNEQGQSGWKLVSVNLAGDYILVSEQPRQTIEVPRSFRPIKLTKRQIDVVRLLSEGMSNRKISQVLGLKEQSIKNLVSGAMKNLQAENRTQLVLRYLEMAGPEIVGDR